jgi:hypothetical protein
MDLGPLLVTLLLWVVLWVLGLAVLYWIIRLAVRHAIEDADRRRNQPPAYTPSQEPRVSGRRPPPPAAD